MPEHEEGRKGKLGRCVCERRRWSEDKSFSADGWYFLYIHVQPPRRAMVQALLYNTMALHNGAIVRCSYFAHRALFVLAPCCCCWCAVISKHCLPAEISPAISYSPRKKTSAAISYTQKRPTYWIQPATTPRCFAEEQKRENAKLASVYRLSVQAIERGLESFWSCLDKLYLFVNYCYETLVIRKSPIIYWSEE